MSVILGCALRAMHLPGAHGGEGADALATVTTVRELARVCASATVPAVILGGCA
jgi:alkylation response protein AidB-like acyl-CoA dehydrogenase